MRREIFIAGIIQGSDKGRGIYDQGYRKKLKSLLTEYLPEVEVYCPFENHPNSIDYDSEKGKRVFFELMERASQADILIAFLPQASLGTAIELWQAHQAKKIIFTISPMTENWVIKFLPDKNFTTLTDFEEFIRSGEFETFIENHEQHTTHS